MRALPVLVAVTNDSPCTVTCCRSTRSVPAVGSKSARCSASSSPSRRCAPSARWSSGRSGPDERRQSRRRVQSARPALQPVNWRTQPVNCPHDTAAAIRMGRYHDGLCNGRCARNRHRDLCDHDARRRAGFRMGNLAARPDPIGFWLSNVLLVAPQSGLASSVGVSPLDRPPCTNGSDCPDHSATQTAYRRGDIHVRPLADEQEHQGCDHDDRADDNEPHTEGEPCSSIHAPSVAHAILVGQRELAEAVSAPPGCPLFGSGGVGGLHSRYASACHSDVTNS